MAEATQAWLKTNVGVPSGTKGDIYTAIYNKTADFQASKGKSKNEKLEALLNLVGDFSYAKPGPAATPAQCVEKDRQQRYLNDFAEELKMQRLALNPGALIALREKMKKNATNYPLEKSLVIQVLEDMKASSVPLLANTGKGIDQNRIVMVLSDTVSGSFNSAGIMQINPNRTRNKTLLMGLLVHEYHHKLCYHNGSFAYADEFVAHWKEYSIIKPAPPSEEARAQEINRQLLKLYGPQIASWYVQGFELFNSIAEAGDFLVPDNAMRKSSSCRHGAARLPETRRRGGTETLPEGRARAMAQTARPA